jgi:hypothetical protein
MRSKVYPKTGNIWFKLLLVLAALLLATVARAQCSTSGATTTCTSSDTISTPDIYGSYTGSGSPPFQNGPYAASPYPSEITVNGLSGTVASIQVTLSGMDSKGNNNSHGQQYSSVWGTEIMVVSPGNKELEIFGEPGDSADGSNTSGYGDVYNCAASETPVCGLQGLNVTIADGNTPMPGNNGGSPSNPTGQVGSGIMPQTGSYTYEPSSYPEPEPYPSGPPFTTPSYPQSQGTSTLSLNPSSGVFTNVNPNGTWKLYMMDQFGDPVTIHGWTLQITVNSLASSNTSVSQNLQPSFSTGPDNSVTFTATVSSQGGTPTGTVTFTANGSNLTCASGNPAAVSGSQATCTTTFGAEGINQIVATYSGNGTTIAGSSSTTLDQLVEVHASQSGDQWCNNSSLSIPSLSIGPPAQYPIQGYPSVIGVSGVSNTVGNVQVQLNGVLPANIGLYYDSFLLVAPNGKNLDFLDGSFSGGTNGKASLTFGDGLGASAPEDGDAASGSYLATDNRSQATSFPALSPTASSLDPSIPAIPGTINYAQPWGGGGALDFESAFGNSPANGDWSLYIYNPSGGDNTEPISLTGWCLNFTLNSGSGTTTAVTSLPNPVFTGNPITLTATVTSNDTPVTSGTVTFIDSSTNTTLASNVALTSNGTASVSSTSFPSPLVEGDHNITATYSGVTNTYNASTGNLWVRENTATTFSGAGTSQSPALFCNPGGITLPNQVENPTEEGAAAPNPSNIFVNNLPGTISSVEVELEQFQNTTAVDTITATASLLVGPGATSSNSLNFFTGTGAPDNSTVLSLGNYYFSDSGSEPVPESNYGPGIYQPASYSLVQVNNTFTPSLSGFYTLPGSFDYAQPHDPAYTFGDLYNTTNPNGTWSLYFNQYTSTDSVSATAAGWCMGFVENLPGATVTTESTDTFTQGQQNAPFMVNITNNGPGPTGDPTNGSNPMTVTDTLNSAFTYTGGSGTGWSCSTPPATTVTCTYDAAVAQDSSYPELTLSANVSPTASGNISNSVSAGGAGVATTSSNTDTIAIEALTTTSAANVSTTFSSSSQSVTLQATVSSAGSTVNAGTVTFSVSGIAGSSSVTSGTVTNGVASAVFTVPGGTGAGSYAIIASYNPGGGYEASSDNSHTLTIAQASTTTAASSQTVGYSASSQNVSLTATVSSVAGAVNGGTFSFAVTQNSTTLCSVTSGTVASGAASATCTVPGGTEGVFSITAIYNGGVDFLGSSDTTQTLTIVIANTLWIGDSNNTTAAFAASGIPSLSTPESSGGTGVAIDSKGNVWSLNPGLDSVAEFNSLGTTTNTYSNGGLSTPTSLTIDGANQVWITNSNNSISVFASSGSPISTAAYAGDELDAPSSVAIDISGNVWIANSGGNSVTKVLGAAVPTVPLAMGVVNGTPATEP